jgi:periplasmic divalent cation tolerance protein
MSGVAILVTTVESVEAARTLARAALESRLAACVQITPVTSLFVWKDEFREAGEVLLQMKHRAQDYAALAELVRRLHSYETPEILRIDAADADPAYAAWIDVSTQRS